jgi:hypothetical protein
MKTTCCANHPGSQDCGSERHEHQEYMLRHYVVLDRNTCATYVAMLRKELIGLTANVSAMLST